MGDLGEVEQKRQAGAQSNRCMGRMPKLAGLCLPYLGFFSANRKMRIESKIFMSAPGHSEAVTSKIAKQRLTESAPALSSVSGSWLSLGANEFRALQPRDCASPSPSRRIVLLRCGVSEVRGTLLRSL